MRKDLNKAEARENRIKAVLSIKFLCAGLISGIILSPVLLFSFGYITTSSNADRLVQESANKAEALAILPYCVANFGNSVNVKENIAALQKANYWERGEFIMEGGWAMAPDGTDRGSQVANTCADELLANAKAAEETSR